MEFRPCIDLRGGQVVQIVGASLRDDAEPTTNFVAAENADALARRYRADGLFGGHVISLGPGNEAQVAMALSAYPGGLQVGGGVNLDNASDLLDAGASHVIVTSYVFRDGALDEARLAALIQRVGADRLVLDLSCRFHDGAYWVVTDRWQRFTRLQVDAATLGRFSRQCAELLVHGVDVEGKQLGVDEALVALLGEYTQLPVTYAGGVRSLADLELIEQVGAGRVNATVGSALDIFGGSLPYEEVVLWHRRRQGDLR